MKKLLSTSAFLGALAMTAGHAEAANLQVNVGGFIDFQAGYTDDQIIHRETAGTAAFAHANPLNFNNDTEVHFTVEGVADNGLEYGAVIELEADVGNTDAKNGGLNADKAYLFGQGAWGRLELGSNTDASQALAVNSATFASGTGGVDGDFYRYTPIPTTFAGIIRPELPISDAGFANGAVGNPLAGGESADEDATKITYYSPRIAGFQAGASFIPNSTSVGFTPPNNVGFTNVLTAGVNFTTQFNQFAIKLAATGQSGDYKGPDTDGNNDLRAWQAGGNVSFAGFTVGGSYGDWLNTLGNDRRAQYYDAGVGYAFGPWSVSGSYLRSETDEGTAGSGLGVAVGTEQDKFENIVIGTDYKLAPGLVPYAEVSFFDFNGGSTGATTAQNDGTVVIVGTQLTF